METWHDTARTLPHAHSSIWRLQGFGAGLRGGVSGWGFGVGFRGFRLGFRGGVVMPCAPHGNVAMECEINTQNKPGSPWRKLVAIHNFVASAFLHYKISTQKWFKFRRLCQWPWNVKSTLKTNPDRLGENWLLSTTSELQLIFCTTKYLLRSALDPASWCLSQTTHVQATRTTHVQATQATHVQATVRPHIYTYIYI